jgi:hypothetical protein
MYHLYKIEEYDEDQVREYNEDLAEMRYEIRRRNREFMQQRNITGNAFNKMMFAGLENNTFAQAIQKETYK